jgi:hypothetical protein
LAIWKSALFDFKKINNFNEIIKNRISVMKKLHTVIQQEEKKKNLIAKVPHSFHFLFLLLSF